jgi:hypothetical protein
VDASTINDSLDNSLLHQALHISYFLTSQQTCTFWSLVMRDLLLAYLIIVKRISTTPLITNYHGLLWLTCSRNWKGGGIQGYNRRGRLCKQCSACEVEDELHFIVKCEKYSSARLSFYSEINNICKNFMCLNDSNMVLLKWGSGGVLCICQFYSRNLQNEVLTCHCISKS